MILRGEPELSFKIPHKVIIKNHKKSKPRETEKRLLIHLTIGGKQTGGSSPGGKDKKGLRRKSEGVFQDGHGVMIFSSSKVSHSRWSSYFVCDGRCTLTCCSHIFCAHRAHCVLRTSSCVSHTHGSRSWKRCLLHAHVVSLDFSHVSPVSICSFCTVTSRPTSPTHPSTRSGRTFPAQKRGSSALRTRTSSLATWPRPSSSQVMSPKSSTRSLPWMLTRRPSTIRTIISLTSRRPQARTLDTVFWILCFARFSLVILLFREKAKKACLGKQLQGREREEREGSVTSVAESVSRKSRRNSTRSHSLQTQSWWTRSPRTPRTKSSKSFLGENSVQRKLYSTEYDMEIQNLERRNSEYALFESQRELESQRLQLLEDNQWTDQAQRERIHLSSELKMKNRLHQECYAKSCREFEELKRHCYQEENTEKKQRRLGDFYAAWSGITHSESIERSSTKITRTIGIYWRLKNLLRSWLTEQLWQCLRSSSSSHYFEFKKA